MIFFPNQTAEMLMDFNYLEITFIKSLQDIDDNLETLSFSFYI
jgi:hypothetical protein